MPIRGSSLIPSTVTKSLICVDKMTAADFSGTIYNPYMPGPMAFESSKHMVWILEDFFNDMAFPQAYYEDRSFRAPKVRQPVDPPDDIKRYMSDDVFDSQRGKVATFIVQVQFRQNATWQGTVTWNEQKQVRSFRSTLELLKLMDSIQDDE